MRDSGRAVAICSTIIETARLCNLDKVSADLTLVLRWSWQLRSPPPPNLTRFHLGCVTDSNRT